MKLTIELPDSVQVSAGDATVDFEFAKIAKDKLAEFVAMAAQVGIMKAGNDSASGAAKFAKENKVDVEEARETLITKWCNARYESGGFDRRTGDGVGPVDREAIRACRQAVKASDEKWYKAASEEQKWQRMVEYFDGLDETKQEGLRKWATAEIARKAEAAKARKAALEAIGDLGIEV